MPKHDKETPSIDNATTEFPPPPAPTVAIAATDLSSLLQAAVDQRLATIMTAKGPDERIREAIERQRGIGLPTPPEFLVECRSPLTGATFTARLIASKTSGTRVVELLEYERPVGWDVKKKDGGLVENGDQMPLKEANGSPGVRYTRWLYETFWKQDANAIGGKPLPDQWKRTYTPTPGSVTITPEQMKQLGLDPEQLRAALAVDVGDKAAE